MQNERSLNEQNFFLERDTTEWKTNERMMHLIQKKITKIHHFAPIGFSEIRHKEILLKKVKYQEILYRKILYPDQNKDLKNL